METRPVPDFLKAWRPEWFLGASPSGCGCALVINAWFVLSSTSFRGGLRMVNLQLCLAFLLIFTSLALAQVAYKVGYSELHIDHFNFAKEETFKLRYLYTGTVRNRRFRRGILPRPCSRFGFFLRFFLRSILGREGAHIFLHRKWRSHHGFLG